MLLRLYSNAPSKATLTVCDDLTDTGYALSMDGLDFGTATKDTSFSGPRGTQGARPANGTPQNRATLWPIKVVKSASKDSMIQRFAMLDEIIDEMARFGGRILWQSASQTYRQWFDVLDAGWAESPAWTLLTETNWMIQAKLGATCSPRLSGDPMDTYDTFSTDTSADYTADSGTTGTLSVSGGQLVPSNTGAKRYRHTAKGYVYGDVQVTLKITLGGTIVLSSVTGRADVTGLSQMLAAEIGVSNLLVIRKYLVSGNTALATTAFTPAVNTTYWLRLRLEGNVCTAEVFTSKPTPVSAPAASVSYTLTAAEAAVFGPGHAGIRLTVGDTAERYDDFEVWPFTFRLLDVPEQIRLYGQIPGDAPATADIVVTPQGGTGTPIWGQVSWLERPLIQNLCWNGDFEDTTIAAGGWTAGAISGFTAAGTSVARDTTAARVKYGAADMQIVCPATAETGAAFSLVRRFKKGRQYAAFLWASSAAGTTNARIKLGSTSGDLVSSSAVALSAAKQLYAVTWTPTADRSGGYVAFAINAATATTMNVDGVCVVEVPSIALSAAITNLATTLTPYNTPTDVPWLLPDGTISQPFRFLIGTEMMRCTARDPSTGAWTVSRADEGTTAASHSQDDLIILVPHARPQFEGKGAVAPFGIIEGDAYVAALSDDGAGAFAITADANARGGNVLRWTPATSGAQEASIVYLVDPSTLMPDDYTQGEIDVEVWVREAWATTLGSPRVTVSAQSDAGDTAGPRWDTREYGNVGKLLWPATAKAFRINRLGILPLVVDAANPQRWRLTIDLQAIGGATPTWDIDYLMLVPTRSVSRPPTGKANDTSSPVGMQPRFIPYDAAWGSSSAKSKMLRSDGSSLISDPGGYGFRDLGPGYPIEFPDTDCDLVVKVSTLVPDDPTLDSTSESPAGTSTCVHCSVTPRYNTARAS